MKTTDRMCLQLGLAIIVAAVSVECIAVDRYRNSDSSAVADVEDDGEAQATEFHPADAVQAHSKYFQDFFTVQLAPHKIEFGHVCENPDEWEQRYESKDLKNHRDQGKVRWGDKHGGYGEHYWDYNHAGHGDSHDEGSEQIEDVEDPAPRQKRHHVADQYSYAFDPETGHIIDQNTGKSFILQPID